MKIVIEANIPYIKGLLEPFGEVQYLAANEITNETVKDADALFIRTRTKCNASLLDHTKVKFIATATIGIDHIDSEYCHNHSIAFFNAPGCNAPAVAQYVFATLGKYLQSHPRNLQDLTFAVVGVGNVGKIIAHWGKLLGMKVLQCDPPRARKEGDAEFVTLQEVAEQADIITFHTPLNKDGIDKTVHLADEAFFNNLKHCELLINSSRGCVVDNTALNEYMNHSDMAVAIDCWENEPNINLELLKKVFVATPHIAGYSAEGKQRATAMALEAFEKFYNVKVEGKPQVEAPFHGAEISNLQQVTDSYDPAEDTEKLKATPENFENFRNHYNLRAEVR